MRLFSNRSQRTSKCGKNISDTLSCATFLFLPHFDIICDLLQNSDTLSCTSCATFLFLPHFDVICDLLLNRRMATWNLFVKFAILFFFFNSLLYKTNRFQVVVHLFSNRSQRMSKCGKNISDTLGCTSRATFLFLPHFDIICDLLYNSDTLGCTSCATFLFLPHFDVIYDLFLNRCSATWNLFVKFAILYLKLSISRSSEIF